MKIVVAITGASGSIYAKVLLDKLSSFTSAVGVFANSTKVVEENSNNGVEVGVVMSDNAKTVWQHELGNEDFKKYPFRFYAKNDFMAPFASGSAKYGVMIICPCSMGTLGRIASGVSDDLITRSADVILKERRKLILVVRDTPYNLIHINNMKTVTEAGGIICPATPSFYSQPKTFEQLAATVVDRVLDLAGIEVETYRWGGKI